ncbi:MAG: hypothetical protein M3513_03485, partial [Actinomycetota bacterium]|nr:hypothetical protein [Actinomycetota bacterium]
GAVSLPVGGAERTARRGVAALRGAGVIPVLAFHPSDILAVAAVLGVWIILRRLRRGRRRRDG